MDKLHEGIAKKVIADGFAFSPGFLPHMSTQEVAFLLGVPLSLSGGSPVHSLTPKSADEAADNTYSGNYGLGKFPLHTDLANWILPPRYLLLRCVKGSAEVATNVLSSRSIVDAIGTVSLGRALMKPRRRVQNRIGLLPLLQKTSQGQLFRWDEKYLVPASKAGEEYATEVGKRLQHACPIPCILASTGDILIVDNWKMLHGRASVPDEGRTRQIERAYLKALVV